MRVEGLLWCLLMDSFGARILLLLFSRPKRRAPIGVGWRGSPAPQPLCGMWRQDLRWWLSGRNISRTCAGIWHSLPVRSWNPPPTDPSDDKLLASQKKNWMLMQKEKVTCTTEISYLVKWGEGLHGAGSSGAETHRAGAIKLKITKR